MIVRQFLFKEKLPFINRALDVYALRQKVIAKNIANVTTPNYTPQRVKFEELFEKQKALGNLVVTDARHIGIKGDIDLNAAGAGDSEEGYEVDEREIPQSEIMFSGESHVNIDKEMSELAQNQIRFRFASRILRNYFQELSSVIRGTVR